jgi:HAD superfamily hydrolase (TIGR01490 family)
MRDSVLRLTAGWDREHVRAIARDAIEEVIEPIVYEEALDLIAAHQAAGEPVYLVSASPAEIVAPLADHLGVDGFLATVAQVDDEGRYTGRVELYCYGAEKVVAMRALAVAESIDLERSAAYSDSATDEPMLAAVGHPVAVNPDRELLRIARERGWEVRWFVRPIRLRDRIPRPRPASAAAVGGGLVAGVAGTVTWLWLRRERSLPRRSVATPGVPLVQAWRTFLAASVPRAMSRMSRRSFFIGRRH